MAQTHLHHHPPLWLQLWYSMAPAGAVLGLLLFLAVIAAIALYRN